MWTTEEIRHFLDTNNAREITHRMNLYQQETTSTDDYSLKIKSWPHFLLAFYLAMQSKQQKSPEYAKRLLEFYLKNTPEVKRVLPFIKRPQTIEGLNSTDLATLYQLYYGLEMLVIHTNKELIDWLFTKYNFDFNFIVPRKYQYAKGKNSELAGIDTPLIHKIYYTNDSDLLEFLLTPKYKVNINAEVSTEVNKGVTILYFAANDINTPISLLQMLIDHGADPYHPLTINHPEHGEINTNIYTCLEVSPKMSKQFEKLKQCLQNRKPVVEEGYSSEHSSGSGSNSPASAGSPQSSPPRHSAILQKTPPDSPVASRSVTPPGSPMHTSDNNSSGSAGSSPEKLAIQPATPYQFSIPPGNGDLVHEFHEALKKNRFQDAKAIYDTGRVKPDCYCEPCKVNALHLMMTSHEFKGMEETEEYVLHHVKYKANINSTNDNRKTILHIMAGRKLMTGKGISVFFQKYADKNPDLSMRDNEGNTPLHYAGVSGGAKSHEVVEELLKHGADPTITNRQGLTARELCVRSCPNEDVKKKVLAVFDEQLNPYQKQNLSVQIPVAATVRETTNSAAPIIYTGGNKATMFPSQNNGANGNSLNVVPLSPPAAAQRADAKSVGALYAPPPQPSVELPKRVAKEELAAAPRTDTKKSLGDRVKGLFHLK